MRKHEIRTEEEVAFYCKMSKFHEANRTSTNQRNEFWRKHSNRELDPETSFNMDKF